MVCENSSSQKYVEKIVSVVMDRPLGYKHPKYGFIYPVNYGYVPNIVSGDGEEWDAYVLGIQTPVEKFTGRCIAVVRRTNDVFEKQIHFQEQWFEHIIVR